MGCGCKQVKDIEEIYSDKIHINSVENNRLTDKLFNNIIKIFNKIIVFVLFVIIIPLFIIDLLITYLIGGKMILSLQKTFYNKLSSKNRNKNG